LLIIWRKKGMIFMSKVYCPNCQDKVNFTTRKKTISTFKGYEVNVEENIAVCSICNEDIFVPEIEDDNTKKLYDKYREVANIVSPKDIIEFREKYNISQRELVSIMDWGKMTVNRYEHGSIPNSSHNDLLKLIMSSEVFFKEKVEEAFRKERLSIKSYEGIRNTINISIQDEIKKLIILSLIHKESEFNGFRKFNIERLCNLISYIADKVDLYKTSINKYLWYIDFENFRRNIRSITGLQYIKYTYGPIIEDFKYEEILKLFNENFYIEEKEQDCNTVTLIRSKNNYDLSIFKEEELKVINDIINKFKFMSCNDISELSHQEQGWLENNKRDLINYHYANELKVKFENH